MRKGNASVEFIAENQEQTAFLTCKWCVSASDKM